MVSRASEERAQAGHVQACVTLRHHPGRRLCRQLGKRGATVARQSDAVVRRWQVVRGHNATLGLGLRGIFRNLYEKKDLWKGPVNLKKKFHKMDIWEQLRLFCRPFLL